MLEEVLPWTATRFRRALVMPNLTVPITTQARARAYSDDIRRLSDGTGFAPLMTLKLTQDTTAETIRGAADFIHAVKLYPEGVTTNSTDGVRDLDAIHPDVFRAMAAQGIILSIHAEEPAAFCLDRETAYLPRVARLADQHPTLKIVLEHVTTRAAVFFVQDRGSNMAATITAHHLYLTLNDVVGGLIQPHNFCKPIAKRVTDRQALINAAVSGNPQFFLGTDSAPHARETKESASGCAGCFTAPRAIELCADVFNTGDSNCIQNLEKFMSENGARFYGLKPNSECIVIENSRSMIPTSYGHGTVVPFRAGQWVGWSIKSP
jgi:dihydroorotase